MSPVGLICFFIFYFLVEVSSQFYYPYGNGCPPFMCPLQCKNGYVLDSHGCKICRCSTTGDAAMSNGPMNPGGDPFHQGGVPMSMGGVINNSPSSSTYNKPCVNGTTCDLKCENGFYNGPNGCQFCLCAASQTSNQLSESYNNPCPDAAATCDMVCMDGYQTESSGCQHCRCAVAHNSEATSPAPPVTTTLSEGECMQRITECQLKYPFGFMTDDSCTMCISKDDIYPPIITEEHQPMIRLSNPCIQGFDVCRIFCATGYRRGPRSCQYCACNG
ncbi:antistasin-like [Mercenaria mercenaria]|uniref:antistasin-like n=1 Tax=Mercenaria mercenaria TaxID=6596 RepID=UPI00234EB67C|nr:antistasin-like [Mercenaria mercenaria]